MSEHFPLFKFNLKFLTSSNYHRYYSSTPIVVVVVVDIADIVVVVVVPRPFVQGWHRASMFLRS